MNNLKALKKQRQDDQNFAQEQAKATDKDNWLDIRFWKPTIDKSTKSGSATIRFLPAPQTDSEAGIKFWTKFESYFFKGRSGQWYSEKSPSTIGKPDPVYELNGVLWNKNSDPDCPSKTQVRNQKKAVQYVTNILVIDDPAKPENNGKVFMYQFRAQVFDKIKEAMCPDEDDEDETPMNPFDLWSGATLKMKIAPDPKTGFPSYNKSKWMKPEALSKDDDELEEIYGQVFSLKEFTDPETFKSYDELKARLSVVTGEAKATMENEPTSKARSEKTAPANNMNRSDKDEDEDMDEFQNLCDKDKGLEDDEIPF